MHCRLGRGLIVGVSYPWTPRLAVPGSQRGLLSKHGANKGQTGFYQGIPTQKSREGREAGRVVHPDPCAFSTRGGPTRRREQGTGHQNLSHMIDSAGPAPSLPSIQTEIQ